MPHYDDSVSRCVTLEELHAFIVHKESTQLLNPWSTASCWNRLASVVRGDEHRLKVVLQTLRRATLRDLPTWMGCQVSLTIYSLARPGRT